MADRAGTEIFVGTLDQRLDELVLACRILEMEGHGGGRPVGHIGLRDPLGRGFWMKRAGIGLDEVIGRDDLMLLDMEGHRILGRGKCHNEWPIHSEIFKRRPDVAATAHTHAFYSRVFSAANIPLMPVSVAGSHFQPPPPRYEDTWRQITTPELGRGVAQALGSHMALFLRNHGAVFCGETVKDMLLNGLTLEEACREQLTIAGSGLPWSWQGQDIHEPQEHRANGDSRQGRQRPVEMYWRYYCRKLARLEGRDAGDQDPAE